MEYNCIFKHAKDPKTAEYLKDVHKPRKLYAIWLNFGYVAVYLKILRLNFFRFFYHVIKKITAMLCSLGFLTGKKLSYGFDNHKKNSIRIL